MVSQQELLQETFGDIMRGIGAAAKAVAPGLVQKFDAVAEPFKAFSANQPKAVFMNAIETEFFRTFDRRTVKIISVKTLAGDKPGSNSRIEIKFTAQRFKGISQQSPVGTGAGVQGGLAPAEEYSAILTRSEAGVRGSSVYNVEIRDKYNNRIQGSKDKKEKQRPSWRQAFDDEDWTDPANISIGEFAAWLYDNIGYNALKYGRLNTIANELKVKLKSTKDTNITNLILAYVKIQRGSRATVTENTLLDPGTEIPALKAAFIKSKIFTEQTKKSQLNFLIDSYNMRYEVSINKGN